MGFLYSVRLHVLACEHDLPNVFVCLAKGKQIPRNAQKVRALPIQMLLAT